MIQGNTTAAINKLNAFINQVNSFIIERILTETEGQELISAANDIIAQINNSNNLPKRIGDNNSEEDKEIIPEYYSLNQNYPNPFNPATTIQFALPEETAVLLEIYNSSGHLIEKLVNESMGVGNYNVIWDAANMPSGIYFYRLKAGNFQDLKKMILMK